MPQTRSVLGSAWRRSVLIGISIVHWWTSEKNKKIQKETKPLARLLASTRQIKRESCEVPRCESCGAFESCSILSFDLSDGPTPVGGGGVGEEDLNPSGHS